MVLGTRFELRKRKRMANAKITRFFKKLYTIKEFEFKERVVVCLTIYDPIYGNLDSSIGLQNLRHMNDLKEIPIEWYMQGFNGHLGVLSLFHWAQW